MTEQINIRKGELEFQTASVDPMRLPEKETIKSLGRDLRELLTEELRQYDRTEAASELSLEYP